MGASLHIPKKVIQGHSTQRQINIASQSKGVFVNSKGVRHEGVVQKVDTGQSAVSANLGSAMSQKCIEKAVGMSNQVERVNVQIESGVSDTSNEHQGRNNTRALLFDIKGLEDDKTKP